jgi:cytochrome c5
MLAIAALLLASDALAAPDWREGVRVPADGRPNILELAPDELARAVRAGRRHALEYPVEVTGLLLPRDTLKREFDDADTPFRRLIGRLLGGLFEFRSLDELFAWVGLHEYPRDEGAGAYFVPFPEGGHPAYRMGYATVRRHGAEGITLSCASCHSADLFGARVIGLTNRFPRANHAYLTGKRGMKSLPPSLFQLLTGASPGDRALYAETRRGIRRVGIKEPRALGLDTSLAQVALSLARRAPDEDATPERRYERRPREEPLERAVADSKPAVWWNVRYKNRWLSDGSIVSGNPILTNLLWNEIGRGTELPVLGAWIDANARTIDELTAAVFAAEAPRFTDFFPAEALPPASVARGEAVFQARCARCHGVYEKGWNDPALDGSPWIERLRTTAVRYPASTPVIDVGTDPGRRRGMVSLERALNPLAISRRHGILVRAQPGYVPPPLVGIWARWPYLHNNSVPSLCALLTRSADRPSRYRAGEALDRDRDFDRGCNGYPAGEDATRHWAHNDEWLFDASREGLSNAGHDEGIFLEDGRELLTPPEKVDLIRYLQTL